ncbi:hypothetical protein [Halochromatium sp.]
MALQWASNKLLGLLIGSIDCATGRASDWALPPVAQRKPGFGLARGTAGAMSVPV